MKAKYSHFFRAGLAMYTTAADLIESLTAERDGLAGMVVAKNEALEMFQRADHYQPLEDIEMDVEPMWDNAIQQGREALALTLPAAVAQVAEWREKAALLDQMAPAAIEALDRIWSVNGTFNDYEQELNELCREWLERTQEELAKEAENVSK